MSSQAEIEQLSKEVAELEQQKNSYLEAVKKLLDNPWVQMVDKRIEEFKKKLQEAQDQSFESNFKLDVKRVTKIINRHLKNIYSPQASRLIHHLKALIFTKYEETRVLETVLKETIPQFISELKEVTKQDMLAVCDVGHDILKEYKVCVKIEPPNSYLTFTCPYIRQIEQIWDEFLVEINMVNKCVSPFVTNAKKYLINQVKTKAKGGCDVTIVVDKAIREYMKNEDAEMGELLNTLIFFESVNKVFNPNSKIILPCSLTGEKESDSSEDSDTSDEEPTNDFVAYKYKYSNPEKIRHLKRIDSYTSEDRMTIRMFEKESNKTKWFKIEGLVKV